MYVHTYISTYLHIYACLGVCPGPDPRDLGVHAGGVPHAGVQRGPGDQLSTITRLLTPVSSVCL